MRLGALDKAGADLVADVIAAYSLGIIGWSALQLLTRGSYASADMRTPTLVAAGVTATGSALMLWWSWQSTGDGRVAALGLAHSLAMVLGAVALLVLLARHIRASLPVAASMARSLVCAGAAYLTARAVVHVFPSASRADAALTVVVGGVLAVGVYAGLQWAARAPEFRGIPSEAAV
jgi:putative peptidoglycan lipid II flippase